jgi:GNAT superfamily N-acetyltransferase
MTMASEWRRGEFLISTNLERLQREVIHDFLSTQSYWAQQRSLEVVARSLENSLNFGLYKGERQIGFARVVTDYATFAWLADVFIVAEHRGSGLSKWLLQVITSHPQLQGLRRWVLATRDAHELYRRFGFRQLENPDRWMEKYESQ